MKMMLRSIAVSFVIIMSGCTLTETSPRQSIPSVPQQINASSAAEASASADTGTEASETETITDREEDHDGEVIDGIMARLSVDEKVGQLLLSRFPKNDAEDMMSRFQLGGFTFYASDFKDETPETIREMLVQINSKADVPAFFAVDEEGGSVVRISGFPQYRAAPFSSQLALAEGGEELIKSETEEKARLLASLGINLNLAPVVDIAEDPRAYIFDRTFGRDAETTGKYAAAIVRIMNENRVGCCLKHFPGYGENVDTHTGVAVDTRPSSSFESADLIPFEYGIEAGAPSVMVNHNIAEAYDAERPASLSPAVHRVLREQLGFEGVIISDDLGMDAILRYSGEESPYVLAVLAGNDLICTSDAKTAYEDILAAAEDGRIAAERIDESVRRILQMKIKLGIL